MPLDPSYPPERIQHILNDTQISIILTSRAGAGDLPPHQAKQLYMDERSTDSLIENPQSKVENPSNLACCLYTSGSTGQPKGVLLEHQALVKHFTSLQQHYQLTPADRVLQFASLTHIAGVEQIIMALLSGATLVVPDQKLWTVSEFLAKVKQYDLTVVDLPASYYQTLAQEWVSSHITLQDSPLRLLIVGGEVTSAEGGMLWSKIAASNIRFLNVYGMTEVSGTASLFELPTHFSQNWQSLPIGQPLPNRMAYIVDEQLRPVPDGENGEICIGGTSLARGYLNQPALTTEKFVVNPVGEGRLYRTGDLGRFLPDGNLEYLGRKDYQIQIRGFRVELGEIEAALLAHPAVKETTVVVQGEGANKQLVAYAVPQKDSAQISPTTFKTELRHHLMGKLPPHMIPDTVVLLESMPLTPNGKIDRQTLLAFGSEQRKLPLRVQISDYGSIDNLELVPFEPRELAPDEVEIETQAASLNFRDVINVLGMLREYNASNLGIKQASDVALGYECVGLVTKVGANVSNFRVGDEVIAYTLGSLATLVTVKAIFVVHKPKQLSFAEAAGIPTVFLTAYYGLKELAKIKSGDKVLIHAAAGGVGLAAIQLAQQVGAEIFATASPQKWDYLQALGVNLVMNSRTLDFASEIMMADEGIDVVLNSLNGEFITKSFEVLKEGGCFIELGKLGIWSQEQVTQYRPDVSYLPFDLGDIIDTNPTLVMAMMEAVMTAFENGHLKPLPTKLFPIEHMADAFLYLAQTKHIGKVVLSFTDEVEPLPVIEEPNDPAAKTFSPPQTSTEQIIAGFWKEILSVEYVDTQTSFFELGGNSLLALELLSKIEQRFQVTLPLQTLLSHHTVEQLAQQLDTRQSLETMSSNLEQTSIVTAMPVADLLAEVPPLDSINLPDNVSPTLIEAKAILLTGATGFLGAFLLHELLRQTEAKVYCLVRNINSPAEGKQKIWQNLEHYALAEGKQFDERIIPVAGTLSQPKLGLSTPQFQQLAQCIDLIYHAAAEVDLSRPYSALQPSNVQGTQEILKLATTTKLKSLHYISTFGVFDATGYTGQCISEDTPLVEGQLIYGGYSQSKWVADKMLSTAQALGIPVTIYRPGLIAGHSQTGISNQEDMLCRLLKLFIQQGTVPDLDTTIDMTPVDYVSQAIVHLSKQKSSIGNRFHLINQYPLSLVQLAIEMNKLGYPVEVIPYSHWLSKLQAIPLHAKENVLGVMLPALINKLPITGLTYLEILLMGKTFDCSKTLRSLDNSDIVCPPVNSSLLKRYFSDLIK